MKLADVLSVVPEGPESMMVSGGVVSCGGGGTSTVKVLEAGVASTLPAQSVAFTSKVSLQSERLPYLIGVPTAD